MFCVYALKVRVIGGCPSEYPLQKKRHTLEFLRGIAHLRPRTNTIAAVARVRSALAQVGALPSPISQEQEWKGYAFFDSFL